MFARVKNLASVFGLLLVEFTCIGPNSIHSTTKINRMELTILRYNQILLIVEVVVVVLVIVEIHKYMYD